MSSRNKLIAALNKVGLDTRIVKDNHGDIGWVLHFAKTGQIMAATVDNEGITFKNYSSMPAYLFDSVDEWAQSVLEHFWNTIHENVNRGIPTTLKELNS